MKLRPPQDYVISVRAYTEPASGHRKPSRRKQALMSPWALIFDTETTTDAGQSLRVGVFQLRENGVLREQGIFCSHDLTAGELALAKAYAAGRGLRFMTRDEFIEDVFFGQAYAFRATIIGFNLPFDLARLAIAHASARGAMLSGFSLKLSEDKRRPHVQIKHLSQKCALIRFTAPFRRRDARSNRKRNQAVPVWRGLFVDVHTFATALLSRSFTLATLSQFLGVETRKHDSDEHGKTLTEKYLKYAVDDVPATWQCYQELTRRYALLHLEETPPPLIYSEAGIGKAFLSAMNVKEWRALQTVPPALLATILSSYFGGRSEVRIRREICEIVLCDFLSMYPTVCTLMGLWWFVVGRGMRWRDATTEARERLGEHHR